MPTALALSPHLDDAAFSCGGLLASLAREGWHVVMATLFTASVADPTGFALACQLDKGLPAEVDYMALRRAEDVRAAAEAGLSHAVTEREADDLVRDVGAFLSVVENCLATPAPAAAEQPRSPFTRPRVVGGTATRPASRSRR